MASIRPVLPVEGKRNILITSALPYVNNVPHLGNIIGCVLSADVYARFCRQRGYQTLYICGTDEYGTATETKAMAEKTTPQEICDRYHKLHSKVYDWFNISFDHFGRTTTPEQTQISQEIFNDVRVNDYLVEEETQQLFCQSDDRFLADRLVEGTCPWCTKDAKGDQCDSCGKLLTPTELLHPKCISCGNQPIFKSTKHLYLDLPKLTPILTKWVDEREASGRWTPNAVATTRAWLKEGLKPRAITRDLKWGVPVPLEEYKNKVFYVWFDAPIGYISITATYTSQWKLWWLEPKNKVELVQFMGKDNTPFHTIIFPCSLFGTRKPWTLLDALSTTEYLTYEGDKFSKSKNRGVFGDQVMDTGLESDIWRYYLLSLRPEGNDSDFSWEELKNRVNADLADNLGNFTLRVLSFIESKLNGPLPSSLDHYDTYDQVDTQLEIDVNKEFAVFMKALEEKQLRQGLSSIMIISKLANLYLQTTKPWILIKENPKKCHTVLSVALSLVRFLSVCLHPYTPVLSATLFNQLGYSIDIDHKAPQLCELLSYPEKFTLDFVPKGHKIGKPSPLVPRIGADLIQSLRLRFTPELARAANKESQEPFVLDLRVGKIVSIQDHPQNENLYVLKINLGGPNQEERQVVAGIKSQYSQEKLQDRLVIVVCNLQQTKFRGELSQGMLLAVVKNGVTALLQAQEAQPGCPVLPVGFTPAFKPNFEGKKVKGLPFKFVGNQVTFSNAQLKAGEHSVTVTEEGSWEGGLIQ